MTIQYAVPIPENETRKAQGKTEILHVGLLTTDSDGKPMIQEIPVRKSYYEKLTATQKLAYVKQCGEYHHPADRAKREARLAAWTADNKAKSDAAIEAARQVELAKFIVTPAGFVKDKEGNVVGVQATITHQGHICTANIGLVAELAEQNARVAWQASKDAADAVVTALNAFAVGV